MTSPAGRSRAPKMTEADACPTASMARDGTGGRIRIGLADLMAWVLGAGFMAAACRGVKPWTWLAPRVDVDRLLGLSAASLAVLLGIGLLRQASVLIRRRMTIGKPTLVAALGWRAVVVMLLGLSLAVE